MLYPSNCLEILKKWKVTIEKSPSPSPEFKLSTVHNFFPILIIIIVLVAIFVGVGGSGGLDCAKIKNPSLGLLS